MVPVGCTKPSGSLSGTTLVLGLAAQTAARTFVVVAAPRTELAGAVLLAVEAEGSTKWIDLRTLRLSGLPRRWYISCPVVKDIPNFCTCDCIMPDMTPRR